MDVIKLKELMETVLAGSSFDGLIEKCAHYLENPLVVLDNGCHIIASSKEVTSDDAIWKEATKRGYITVEFSATLDNWDEVVGKGKRYFDVSAISDKRRRFFKLRYRGTDVGYLNVLEDHHPLEDIELEDYLFISELVSKELVFEYQKEKVESSNIKEEQIILELIHGRFIDRPHFSSRIFTTRLDGHHHFHVALINFTHYISYNAADDIINDTLKAYIPNSVLTFYDKHLVVLTMIPLTNIPSSLCSFLDEHDLGIGISDGFFDLYEFNIYLDEAKAALRLKDLAFDRGRIVNYSDIRSYHLLEKLDQKTLLRYCDQRIVHLADLDRHQGSSYIETLYTYLYYDKSINKTAKKLFVHRNTINYRIQKIKEIIDADQRLVEAQLFTSCQIIRYLRFCE